VQETFSKKEQELAKLRRDYVLSVIRAGKLTAYQSDWLSNEMRQKHEAAQTMFAAALSKRLAAVRDRSAKQKRLVESEVRRLYWKFYQTKAAVGYLPHKPRSRHCHLAIGYSIHQRVFGCKYLRG